MVPCQVFFLKNQSEIAGFFPFRAVFLEPSKRPSLSSAAGPVMSSCLCKKLEGAVFPFQVEALENGVDDPIHALYVDEADHGSGSAPYFHEAALNDVGGA